MQRYAMLRSSPLLSFDQMGHSTLYVFTRGERDCISQRSSSSNLECGARVSTFVRAVDADAHAGRHAACESVEFPVPMRKEAVYLPINLDVRVLWARVYHHYLLAKRSLQFFFL